MANIKIQDESEIIRWFEEGRTYRWMCEQYLTKYNLQVQPSMFGNFRRRHGLPRRYVRNDTLIPWAVKQEHRWEYPVMMLRLEARKREGKSIGEENEGRLAAWHRHLDETGSVLHYDPDTPEGWFYVARRKGIDQDVIREPERKTTTRRNADGD